MTLANLLAIQRLQAFEASPQGVQRLLAAAERNLADAQLQALSAENRFDAAYKCILQCAMLGLWANGWRTSTSQPGHHQTAIQTLDQTLGVPKSDLIVLDALRRQRIKFLRRKKIAPHASRACLDSCLLWLAQKRLNGIRTPTFEHQSVFRLPSHGL
jgi:hypothetical protein